MMDFYRRIYFRVRQATHEAFCDPSVAFCWVDTKVEVPSEVAA